MFKRAICGGVAALAITTLAACSGSAGDTTAAEPVGHSAGTTDDFKDAMQPYTDLMDEASSEMTAAGDAASDFEIDAAVRHGRKAADLFGQLRGIAVGLPGADSTGGEASIKAFTTCEAANRESADAVEALDTDAIESAVDHLQTCGDAAVAAAHIFSA